MEEGAELTAWELVKSTNARAIVTFLMREKIMPWAVAEEFVRMLDLYCEAHSEVMRLKE